MSNRWLIASPAVLALALLPSCRNWDTIDWSEPTASVATVTPDCSDVGGPTGEVLASDPNASPALALTSTAVYWVDRGATISDSIQAVPLSGGTPQTVYTASPDPTGAIEDIVTDGTNLYFIEVTGAANGGYTSQIESMPIAGGTPSVLATDSLPELVLSLADGYVYFTDGSTLSRVATTGGTVDDVGGASGGLASQGSSIFWTTDGGELVKRSTPNADTRRLVDESFSTYSSDLLVNLTANDSDVFWVCSDDSGPLLCATSEGGDNVQRIVAALPEAANGPVELAADDANVYFITSDSCDSFSTLSSVPVGGPEGSPTVIASGFSLSPQLSMPHAIVSDGQYVYWTGSGQVFRAPN
jgi:hypothetical protein